MILAADVGGTKTQFGLFKRVDRRLRVVREAAFVSRERPSFEAIVREFLAQGNENVHRCAVGVAGPVLAGRSLVVNLRWPVDARRLARELGLAQVDVINDLEAMAWGIPELPRNQLASLTPGLRAGSGNGALIAAGTSLGMALLATGATGGVWVGGGIAPRLLSKMRGGSFLRAFRAKGRLAPLMKNIPVRVIREPRTVLLGAARVAASRHSSPKMKG